MEANSSYGTVQWADHLDNGPAPAHVEPNEIGEAGGRGGVKAKYGKKVGEGLGKTKAVASSGARKVKEGTSAGVQWIKDKYHKATLKR
ncbi:50S ribosomal protein [Actinidia chinensis var. chinensis]|uniref:50S ribosomal protein n=1 Tax=Actinidia chinensis var. chinensis TaxID=1590841 RepID=A0A2R6PU94_ACTCC|nr:50S ribosomal protein [Actinidia chinensis var. chinensis]